MTTGKLGNVDYKMQIEWNRKTTEWFRQASEYTGFHQELSKILMKSLGRTQSLCDLGCGAAMIDFELCRHIPKITCIDQSREVIDLLNEEIRQKQISNMKCVCQPIEAVNGHWDCAILLFVGNGFSDIAHLLELVDDKVIIVYRGGCINNPDVEGSLRTEHSLLPAVNCMLQSGVKCSTKVYSLEYGQPFLNLKEAYDYVALYHKNRYQESIRHYVEKNVVKTGDSRYPYYLPYRKQFGVFEIRKEENLHLVGR